MRPLPFARARVSIHAALVVALLTVGACARSADDAADTAGTATADSAAGAAVPAATGSDTGMAGMDHSKMAGMDRGPARDADHEFLRMMVDHHQGLVTMMEGAMSRASSADAKADAEKLHHKQSQEQEQMIGMVKSSYNETIQPMVMPNNKEMNDSLQQKAGAAYDRDMYRHVVMHHREGVQMIDRFLPRLQKADVKSMAEKMRADQQREITEFEAKAAR